MEIDEILLEKLNKKFSSLVMTTGFDNGGLLKIETEPQGEHILYVWTDHLLEKDILKIAKLAKAYFLTPRIINHYQVFLNSKTSNSAKFLKHVCKSWAPAQAKIAGLISGTVAVDIVGLEKALQLWSFKNKKKELFDKFSHVFSSSFGSDQATGRNCFAYLIPGALLASKGTTERGRTQKFAEKLFSDSNTELVSTFLALESSENLTLGQYSKKWNGSLYTNVKNYDLDTIMTTLILLKSEFKDFILFLTRDELIEFSLKFMAFTLNEKYPLDLIIPRMMHMSRSPHERNIANFNSLVKEASSPEEFEKGISIYEDDCGKLNDIKLPSAILNNGAACAVLVEIFYRKGLDRSLEIIKAGEAIWLAQYEMWSSHLKKYPDRLAVTLLLKELLEADDNFPIDWIMFSSEHLFAAREKLEIPLRIMQDQIDMNSIITDALSNLE